MTKDDYASNVLSNIQEVTPFSKLYFSIENINELQRLIRYRVYIRSDKRHIISKQQDTELVIIMRARYLQHARIPSSPKDYPKEIKRLNELVIEYILPEIISNIEQYIGYRRDSQLAPRLIDRPNNPSVKGQRELRAVTDVLSGDFFS